MHHFFSIILDWINNSKYFLLYIGAIAEGPILMIASGTLFKIGQFSFVPMYVALVAGDFTADIGWYMVGYLGAAPFIEKHGARFNITPEIIERVTARFKKHEDKILWISKLTMGFGFALATILVAGMMKTSPKKFALIYLLGGLVWTLFLIAVGYFLGNFYGMLIGPLRIVFWCAMIIIVTIVLRYINRSMTQHLS